MLLADWSQKVAPDYRTRIIIDGNNPILAFKANRDRYTNLPNQLKYAGLPYLGSSESEDAVTWNFFRNLQKAESLNIVSDSLVIGDARGLLLWTLAPEVDDVSAELQYKVGELIRRFDGIFRGQMTEPDAIILGTKGIAIIECKLSESDKAPSHLWQGQVDSVKKRLPIYRQKNPHLLKDDVGEADIAQVYQLVRMAFYAVELGSEFRVQPIVVSLANRGNWSRRIGRLGKSASDLWDMFRGMLWKNSPLCKAVFWQEFPELMRDRPLETLRSYLLAHPCLRTVS
jgi:hypothetical protein